MKKKLKGRILHRFLCRLGLVPTWKVKAIFIRLLLFMKQGVDPVRCVYSVASVTFAMLPELHSVVVLRKHNLDFVTVLLMWHLIRELPPCL